MPYGLISGSAPLKERHLGRLAFPGGQRSFAAEFPTARSLFLPGPFVASYAGGQDWSAVHGGGATFGALSASCWFYVPVGTTLAQLNTLIGASSNPAANGWGIMWNTATTLKIWVAAHATAANNATSAAITNPTGQWHFVCGTWDSAGGAVTMRIFIDGGTSAADTGTLAVAQSFTAGLDMELGRATQDSVTPAHYLGAYIADAAVWDRALTSGEVSGLYNAGAGASPIAVASAGLRAWYRCGHGQGDGGRAVQDQSGNGFHLTLGQSGDPGSGPRFVDFCY